MVPTPNLGLLKSPFRHALFEAFRALGPESVTKVAEHVGKPSKSVYYQIRKLEEGGLIAVACYRGIGRSREAIYQAVPGVELDEHFRSTGSELSRQRVRRTLKRAEQVVRKAGELSGLDLGEVPHAVIEASVIRLNADELNELEKMIAEIKHYIESNSHFSKETEVAVALCVTPQMVSKRRSKVAASAH